MRNPRFNWTPDKVEELKRIYPEGTREQLELAFPGVKPHALHEYARKRGIRRKDRYGGSRKGDLSPLLKEDIIAYYWAGYIAADGWISKDGQVVVVAKETDKDHLDKLRILLKTGYNYIEEKRCFNGKFTTYRQLRIAIQHGDLGLKFAKKFDFKYQKTYNPPDTTNYNKWTKNKRLAFLCGFIDGDGSKIPIGKGIKIQNHASWIDVHRWMLNDIDSSTRIDKDGYVFSYIRKAGVLKLEKFIAKYELPVMNRKWNV